jgi:hypothetical protein
MGSPKVWWVLFPEVVRGLASPCSGRLVWVGQTERELARTVGAAQVVQVSLVDRGHLALEFALSVLLGGRPFEEGFQK